MIVVRTEPRGRWFLAAAALAASVSMACSSSAPNSGATGGSGGSASSGEDNAACVDCEIAGTNAGICVNTSYPNSAGTSPSTFGCDSFPDAADQASCLALLACLRSTACQDVIAAAPSDYGEISQQYDDPMPCLCNTATTIIHEFDCASATSWSGVCAAQFVAGSSASNKPTVTPLQALFQPIYPTGVATSLLMCDIDSSQPGFGTPSCTTATTCKIPQ